MSTSSSRRSGAAELEGRTVVSVHALPPTAVGCFDAYGLTTLAELAAVGVDRFAVRRWRQRGLVEGPAPGVVRDVSRQASPLQGLAVPLRYLDDQRKSGTRPAVLTGAASLAVQGIEGFSVPARPLVLVERGRRMQARGLPWRVREAAEVAAVERLGLRVAEAGRALADVALDQAVSDRQLRVGFDSARGQRLVLLRQAVAGWTSMRRHAGAGRLLAIHRSGAFRHDSEGERVAWRTLFLPGPILPRCQVWVLPHVRVDFLFEAAALVVEYLGGHHAWQLEADSARTLEILAAGYDVIPVTAGMLDSPRRTAAQIHRIRRVREGLVTAGALPVPVLPSQPPR